MGCVTAEDRIVMCRERLADRAGSRFRGKETLHALRDLIQVVHPRLVIIPLRAHTGRKQPCTIVKTAIDALVRVQKGERGLGGHGRLQKRIRHLQRVHAALEQRIEIGVRRRGDRLPSSSLGGIAMWRPTGGGG